MTLPPLVNTVLVALTGVVIGIELMTAFEVALINEKVDITVCTLETEIVVDGLVELKKFESAVKTESSSTVPTR